MQTTSAFAVDITGCRIKITGEVDLHTAPLMVDAVAKAMTVELDLSEVSFIDTSGLYGLVKLRNHRAALQIIAVSPAVHRVLEVTSLAESLLTPRPT